MKAITIISALALTSCFNRWSPDTAQDSEPQTDTYTPDTGQYESQVAYSLVQVEDGDVADQQSPLQALTVNATGYTYALDADGNTVRTLTETYVHPSGDYCVDDGVGEECTNGVIWTSGRIISGSPSSYMCVDQPGGVLYLIKDGKSKAEVIDVDFEGDDAYTFNRASEVLSLNMDHDEPVLYDGPCAVIQSTGQLLYTAPDSGWVATQDVGTQEVSIWEDLHISPTRVEPLDDSTVVMNDAGTGDLLLVNALDLSIVRRIELGSEVLDFAVDPDHGILYAALGTVGGAKVNLSVDNPQPDTFLLAGDAQQVQVDATTGTALFASDVEGTWVLSLVDRNQVADTLTLEQAVHRLTTPGTMGDFTVWVEGEEGPGFLIYDAVPDVPPDIPPLYVFLVSNVEQPTDVDIDTTTCEGDNNSLEKIQAFIRANGSVLAELDVPMTLGLIYNFGLISENCGDTDFIAELQEDFGFEVGVMVHNKPCYNCTDKTVSGVQPDRCTQTDPNYCNPENVNSSCCFADDEDYCDIGDWDCYKTYMDWHNELIDGAIPGGGAYITSADRHGMWDWDWVRAYQELQRADGSESGYDVTFMGQGWAYSSEVEYDDPRGKNPAPWRIEDGVRTWALEYYDAWTVDSAFSDVLYLPGLAVSTIKLAEWQTSGLFMLDVLDNVSSFPYSEKDFEILTQFLRRAINHRTADGPNVWHFHIHDIGMLNLAGADGAEITSGTDPLRAWVDEMKATYGDYIVWATPSEIRAANPPRGER